MYSFLLKNSHNRTIFYTTYMLLQLNANTPFRNYKFVRQIHSFLQFESEHVFGQFYNNFYKFFFKMPNTHIRNISLQIDNKHLKRVANSN